MNNGLILNLEQQQKLIMTTEMQMLLKYLQMPISELQETISNELQENVVLEADDNLSSSNNTNINDERIYNFEEDKLLFYKEIIRQSQDDRIAYKNENKYVDLGEEISPFNYIQEKKSLKDYLKIQLLECNEEDLVIFICDYIIESLDHRGYLNSSFEEISYETGVNSDCIEYCVNIVQNFRPNGIGARNLNECLKIQLKNKGITDENLDSIIDNHLEQIATNKLKEISKKLKIDINMIQRYCNIIKSLEPKPSRGFYTGEDTKFVLPEAYIRKIGDEYIILLNDNLLPRLYINNMYKDIITTEENNDTKEYLKEKLNSAVLLIKGIQQRQNTVYNILKCIIDLQNDCFNNGLSNLKPMTLKDVAFSIGIHESTVSRAIKDKYICAPFGMVKIKDLFSKGITLIKEDNKISTLKIKEEIKRIIQDEDKTKPLSDQQICEMLSSKGMMISRRTVVKYREEMDIKSSSIRKVFM